MMRRSAFVFLLLALLAALFSFGLVNHIHWLPAQIAFGVCLVFFGITAVLGYTPSHQIRFGKTPAPAPHPSVTAPGSSVMSAPASPAAVSLLYITLGTFGLIWSAAWYWYLRNHPPDSAGPWYPCYGALLTSLSILVIGLCVGQVARAARHAELPPQEATPAVLQSNQNAAARAPVAMPVNPAASAPGAAAPVAMPANPVPGQATRAAPIAAPLGKPS
jgi:hypothetical protein